MYDDDSPIYRFSTPIWCFDGPTAWYFVSLPVEMSEEVDARFGHLKRGWASLPVDVTIGKNAWKTSIFRDSKRKTFILPIKADIRKREGLGEGTEVDVAFRIRSE